MTVRRVKRLEHGTIVGMAAALAVVFLAQVFEGAPVAALWQPTAALVVFGGTLAAVFVSYPVDVVKRTGAVIAEAFVTRAEPIDAVLDQILRYALIARRKGLIAL